MTVISSIVVGSAAEVCATPVPPIPTPKTDASHASRTPAIVVKAA
jgi:hypothetical protein